MFEKLYYKIFGHRSQEFQEIMRENDYSLKRMAARIDMLTRSLDRSDEMAEMAYKKGRKDAQMQHSWLSKMADEDGIVSVECQNCGRKTEIMLPPKIELKDFES